MNSLLEQGFIFTAASRRALGLTFPPIKCVPWAVFQWENREVYLCPVLRIRMYGGLPPLFAASLRSGTEWTTGTPLSLVIFVPEYCRRSLTL